MRLDKAAWTDANQSKPEGCLGIKSRHVRELEDRRTRPKKKKTTIIVSQRGKEKRGDGKEATRL